MSYFKTCPKCKANYDPGERHICEPDIKPSKDNSRALNTDEIGRQLRQLALKCRSAEIN